MAHVNIHHFTIFITFFIFLFYSNVSLASAQAPAQIRKNPLNGTRIHCCALYQFPSVFNNARREPYQLDGIAIDYLSLLQEHLNFSCSEIDHDLSGKDVGYTAFIHQMRACQIDNTKEAKQSPVCKCELGIAPWSFNEHRLDLVDFLPVYLRDELRVIVHIDYTSSSISAAFFISTFTPSVWICISGLVVIWTFLKLLDRRFVPPDENFKRMDPSASWFARTRHVVLKSNLARRLRKSFQSTVARMIGQSDEDVYGKPSSTRQWILNFIIILSGLFLVLTYEATMTYVTWGLFFSPPRTTYSSFLNVPKANLVQETIESEFHSMNDFAYCNIPADNLCIPKGGATETYWRALATRDCHKGKPGPKFISNYDDLIDMVANKTCKFGLMDGSIALLATSARHCNKLVMTGAPANPGGGSFILPHGSEYTLPLTNATLRLRFEGKLQPVTAWYASNAPCEIIGNTTLSLGKLRVFFYAAYGACFLIFLEMILDPQKPTSTSDITIQTLSTFLKQNTNSSGSGSGDSSNTQNHYRVSPPPRIPRESMDDMITTDEEGTDPERTRTRRILGFLNFGNLNSAIASSSNNNLKIDP